MQMTPINPAAMMGTTTSPIGGQGQTADGNFSATLLQMLGGQQQNTELEGFGNLFDSDSEDDSTNLEGAMDLMSMLFMQSGADVNFTPSPMGYQGGTQTAALQQASAQQQAAIQRMAALGYYPQTEQQTGALTAEQLAALAQNGTSEQLLQALGQGGTAQQYGTAATSVDDSGLPKELSDALRKSGVYYGGQVENRITPSVDPLQSAYNRLYGINGTGRTAQAKGTGTVDIEALQQAVDNGTYRFGTAIQETAQTGTEQISPRDILQQIQTGMTEQLSKAQKPEEFIIKLRPEGLGEITVKLVEEAGKIALSITTTTQQAHNALLGEIGTLREALRPYNAEIAQIVQNDPAASFAQQQGMSEHQHNHGSQQDGRSGGQRYWIPEDDTPAEDIRSYAAALSSNLNAYI